MPCRRTPLQGTTEDPSDTAVRRQTSAAVPHARDVRRSCMPLPRTVADGARHQCQWPPSGPPMPLPRPNSRRNGGECFRLPRGQIGAPSAPVGREMAGRPRISRAARAQARPPTKSRRLTPAALATLSHSPSNSHVVGGSPKASTTATAGESSVRNSLGSLPRRTVTRRRPRGRRGPPRFRDVW